MTCTTNHHENQNMRRAPFALFDLAVATMPKVKNLSVVWCSDDGNLGRRRRQVLVNLAKKYGLSLVDGEGEYAGHLIAKTST
jgi:hypothetical protein